MVTLPTLKSKVKVELGEDVTLDSGEVVFAPYDSINFSLNDFNMWCALSKSIIATKRYSKIIITY